VSSPDAAADPRPGGDRIVAEAAAMLGDLDPAATLGAIAGAVRRALGADRATCYVHEPGRAVIAAVHTTETDPERRAHLEACVGASRAQMPVWDYLLDQPEPFLAVEDLAEVGRIDPRLAGAAGRGAFLGIRLEHPSIRVGGAPELLGTIFCSWAAPRPLTAADRADARALATLAALALANARLYGEAVARARESAALAAEQAALRRVATVAATAGSPAPVFHSVAREVAGLLGVDCGLVARFERERILAVGAFGAPPAMMRGTLPRGGAGALARVAAGGRAVRIDDYAALAGDPAAELAGIGAYRSAVAAPVRVDGRLWGAVMAAATGAEPIAPDAERRLSAFAELLGLAIAGALAAADRRRAEREADRQKDAFFSLVSHELRTPLASIKGYLEVLREGEEGEPLDPEERRSFLGIIERNAGRLERLVGDVLFVAGLDEGRLIIERTDVDLVRLARRAVEAAGPAVAPRRIRLGLEAESPGAVLGDPGRLGQALDALISNALKVTPDGGRVDVRVTRRGGAAVVEVADSGPGIPAEERERVFQRFFRTTGAARRQVQGVGLGLTVVKAIVDAHGGTVAVDGEDGRGAIFRVELPLRAG
jgi:signal transduction histidine kinase